MAKEILAGPIPAQVIRVIDGDTVMVRAQIWLGQSIETRVRLKGVDTPELRGKCQQEKDLALKAKTQLIHWIGDQAVWLQNIQNAKFAGRVVSDVRLQDGSDLKGKIIKAGLGRVYNGGRRLAWCP